MNRRLMVVFSMGLLCGCVGMHLLQTQHALGQGEKGENKRLQWEYRFFLVEFQPGEKEPKFSELANARLQDIAKAGWEYAGFSFEVPTGDVKWGSSNMLFRRPKQ